MVQQLYTKSPNQFWDYAQQGPLLIVFASG